MPSRDWRISVQDILLSIGGIERRTASMSFEQFQRDETVTKAVLYDFVIIGEATKNIGDRIFSF